MRRVQVVMWDNDNSYSEVTNYINEKIENAEQLGGVVASTKLVSGSNENGKAFCYVIEFDFPNKKKI